MKELLLVFSLAAMPPLFGRSFESFWSLFEVRSFARFCSVRPAFGWTTLLPFSAMLCSSVKDSRSPSESVLFTETYALRTESRELPCVTSHSFCPPGIYGLARSTNCAPCCPFFDFLGWMQRMSDKLKQDFLRSSCLPPESAFKSCRLTDALILSI